MIWAMLIVLILAALGMPLFAVITAVAFIGFHFAGIDLITVAISYYQLGDMPGLIAIPLFTLAGYLLGESGAPKRLVRLSNALLGWLPGGLAIVAMVACAFFTAFTGASGVTTRTPATLTPFGTTKSTATPSAAIGFSSRIPAPGLRFIAGSSRL